MLDKIRDITGVREPLFLDVAGALVSRRDVQLIGGRYGIGSKDFAPQRVGAVADNLKLAVQKDGFTVGIPMPDRQLPVGPPKDRLLSTTRQCLFFGLGRTERSGQKRRPSS